jgi:AcrR family transcriptional regulator
MAERRSSPPESNIALRREERRAKAEEGDRPSAAQWEAILDAAARVFHRMGYSSANLDDIASEVGLNRSSIYYYVGGKAELLYELGRRTIRESVPSLQALAERDLAPTAMIEALVHQQLELLQDTYPRLFVFHNERRHHTEPELRALIDEVAEMRIALMAGAIEAGQASGEFRPDLEPRTTARLIVGMCAETRFWWRPDGPRLLTDIGGDIARLVLTGMRT